MQMKLGYELECGIKRNTATIARGISRGMGWCNSSDGSIDIEEDNSTSIEFNSCVYNNTRGGMKRMRTDFKKIIPYINDINESMGLHIHISFKQKRFYKILCSYDFVRFFQNRYRRNFRKECEQERMWNEYCKFYDDAGEFNRERKENFECGKDFSINFGAYEYHKTIEFRIFPATKSFRTFNRYANFLKKTVKLYIRTHRRVSIHPDVNNFYEMICDD